MLLCLPIRQIKDMDNSREVNNIEYQIRKLERGIKVAHRGRLTLRGSGIDYDSMIKQYVKDIKELRDRLEKLTGRRRPRLAKWPA